MKRYELIAGLLVFLATIGTFPFMCTIWCSDEHLQMTGEVTVE